MSRDSEEKMDEDLRTRALVAQDVEAVCTGHMLLSVTEDDLQMGKVGA